MWLLVLNVVGVSAHWLLLHTQGYPMPSTLIGVDANLQSCLRHLSLLVSDTECPAYNYKRT